MMGQVHGSCRVNGHLVRYAGVTDPGRVRDNNEDDLLLLAEAGLFAVADGLGGLDAGEVASRTALAELRELSGGGPSGQEEDPSEALTSRVAMVNRRVYNQRLTLGKNMATTLALVQLLGTTCLVAHVGDSRVYLWRANQLRRLTSDHSLVSELCLQGVLTPSQAEHSLQRHVITRAIGAESSVAPSIRTCPLYAGDLLLLCTDGLTSMVADADIATLLSEGRNDPVTTTDRLVRLANEAGGHDNITVILLAIQPA